MRNIKIIFIAAYTNLANYFKTLNFKGSNGSMVSRLMLEPNYLNV